jgi:hypothetical protein
LPFGLPSGDHPRREGVLGQDLVEAKSVVDERSKSLARFSSARSAARRTRVCASRANWVGFGEPLESGLTAAAIECRVISFLPQPHHADVQTAAVVPAGWNSTMPSRHPWSSIEVRDLPRCRRGG